MNLKQKVIAVTGAGQGIGRALSLTFAESGSQLALIDLDALKLEETCVLASKFGVAVRPYIANVALEDQVDAVIARTVSDFGRLDGVINNAGIVRDALLVNVKQGSVHGRMSLDHWRTVIDVNLTGVFLCGRAAAENMIRLGNGGVILNISSISRHGNTGQSNYSAAKAGVTALTEVWAKELARYGIRTGSIAPGFVRTEMLASMAPEVLMKVVAPVPLKRLGEPEEIAAAARFIFENEFFTGRCIDLDGGLRL